MEIEGNPTLCSIQWAKLSNIPSWKAGPMSCKPMGRPLLDKAVGTETAGRPFGGGRGNKREQEKIQVRKLNFKVKY